MKNILTAAILIMATPAFAKQNVTDVVVYDHTKTITQNIPVTETICENVQVPIYGTVQGQGASGGDVLAGMIIGGILGKGVTGNDNGAAAGAVMGGIIAADQNNGNRQVITGYRTERQCSEVMVRQEVSGIRDYLITFEWNGIYGSAYTYNNYTLGQRIPVEVNIRAK